MLRLLALSTGERRNRGASFQYLHRFILHRDWMTDSTDLHVDFTKSCDTLRWRPIEIGRLERGHYAYTPLAQVALWFD